MSEEAAAQKQHILVVHDDLSYGTPFNDVLVEAGYMVTAARGAASAFDAVEKDHYDLVLLDLHLAGDAFVKSCHDIRAIPGYQDAPIVILAGVNDTVLLGEAYNAGVTDFITTPITDELLTHRVRYILRTNQNMKEIRAAKDRMKILKKAIASLPIGTGIMITDIQGKIVYANAKEAEMHGYTSEEIIGMEARDLDVEASREPYPPVAATKAVLWERERIAARRNGEAFPVRLSSLAVTDADGECIGIVTACEDITAEKETEKKIELLACYDSLTELPNRITLVQRLRQAICAGSRAGKCVGVLFLDLDNFKDVNDTLGHGLGDSLLKEIACRLLAEIREGDTVARIGGDEFVIVLTSISGREEASIAAQRILSIFSKPLVIKGLQLYSGASIGIAMFPDDAQDPEDLLKCSDAAMFRAKGEGRATYWFFSDEINRKIKRRVTLERHLREGIEKQEFYVRYQPQWDLQARRLTGVEALLRWNNAEFGLVAPSEFIQIAEMSGYILELGKWVLRTACIQAKSWERSGVPLKVAVNISGKQLRHPDLLKMVRDTIRETGVNAGSLEFEITESVIMEKADSNITTLKSLKEMGVHLSVDDFGTGYSSLSYLKHFPLDRIKIDRSFITDLNGNKDGAAIIDAIVTMAHSLRLKVLAEGVENSCQMDILRKCRCDEMQGFYLSDPMNADAVADFVEHCSRPGSAGNFSYGSPLLLPLPVELPQKQYTAGAGNEAQVV